MKPILVTHKEGEVRLHVPYPATALSHGQAVVLAMGLIEAAIEAREYKEGIAKDVVREVLEKAGFKYD